MASVQCGVDLSQIPNLPGYRGNALRPQKHRQTLRSIHGYNIVTGGPSLASVAREDSVVAPNVSFVEDKEAATPFAASATWDSPNSQNSRLDRPLSRGSDQRLTRGGPFVPTSPSASVRLDRSLSRGSDAKTARSFGDLSGRYSLVRQKKDLDNEVHHMPSLQKLPQWLEFDRPGLPNGQVLGFKCYFEEVVRGSALESKRVRKCLLFYYLEDDTLQLVEPAEENSGLPQGCIVRRHRVPRPDGEFFAISDLKIGASLELYKKLIHLYDCDAFTRKTLQARGLPVTTRLPSPLKRAGSPVGFEDELTVVTRMTEQASVDDASLFPGNSDDAEALPCPEGEYEQFMRTKRVEDGLDQSVSRNKVISPEIGGAREAQLGRPQVSVDLGLPIKPDLGIFLENSGKVLSFECVWDDTQTLYGTKGRYTLNYFLADDAVEVVALDSKSGHSAPKLLGKQKLLLPEFQDEANGASAPRLVKKCDCYDWRDLRVGSTVVVFNRTLSIVDADLFTRNYFTEQGMPLLDRIATRDDDPDALHKLRPKTPVPPCQTLTGTSLLGSPEDSLRSVYSISPKKKLQNASSPEDGKVLRYQLRLKSENTEDATRVFTLQYFLVDDTCAIKEPVVPNSGHIGGSFARRHKMPKPPRFQTLPPKPVAPSSAFQPEPRTAYYEASDLYVGASIEFLGNAFVVERCDEFTLKYMEARPSEFPQSDVNALHFSRTALQGLPSTCAIEDLQRALSFTAQEATTLYRAARARPDVRWAAGPVAAEAVRRVLLGA